DTTYWNIGGISSLTFSQTSLTNWAAGGDNSTSFHGHIHVFADHVKGPAIYENTLELGYGLLKQGERGFIKADDKISYHSKYGRRLSSSNKYWYWTTNINFRSQFAGGYNQNDLDTKISDWLAPGYVFLSIGIDYKLSKNFWVAWAPISAKVTIVNNEELSNRGAFGVEPGKNSRSELGSYVTTVLKTHLLENINFESKLQLFSDYKEDPLDVDINWETTFVLKVNSFITTNIINQLIYDSDIDIPTYDDQGETISEGPKIQFKNIFGVGLTYKFGHQRRKNQI
ncbi:MAG: DUF3078 domain-containing protein, partial [Cyclobacteriaceae bacterium]|nr:DUF3078 domain-containing protein [Cyclobacteriaceae bacterium]